MKEDSQKQSIGKKRLKLKKYEGSTNIREIAERGCRIAIASVESQDGIRGGDFSMAHLSEVAFWRSGKKKNAEDFIRSVCGSIHYGENTMIVMESTANGVGNYFHREWLRAKNGESDKVALFVPWYAIDIYNLPVADPMSLWESLDEYEQGLWKMGLTLEQINWYHNKRKEYQTHWQMMAEFPTTDVEAFINSASRVFSPENVMRLRSNISTPIAIGDVASCGCKDADALRGVHFVEDTSGNLKVWEFPSKDDGALSERYVVGVDIGGVSQQSDWSVITVMDCGVHSSYVPRIVASWRGHIDHDLLAWKCGAIARWYNDALLVIESNTLEQENTDGDPSNYILNRLGRYYKHLYYRRGASGNVRTPGLHVNRATKTSMITELIGAVRDECYIERDAEACDEFDQYERRSDGSYGAREGCHDDMLMTRALILSVLSERRVSPFEQLKKLVNR